MAPPLLLARLPERARECSASDTRSATSCGLSVSSSAEADTSPAVSSSAARAMSSVKPMQHSSISAALPPGGKSDAPDCRDALAGAGAAAEPRGAGRRAAGSAGDTGLLPAFCAVGGDDGDDDHSAGRPVRFTSLHTPSVYTFMICFICPARPHHWRPSWKHSTFTAVDASMYPVRENVKRMQRGRPSCFGARPHALHTLPSRKLMSIRIVATTWSSILLSSYAMMCSPWARRAPRTSVRKSRFSGMSLSSGTSMS